MTQYIITMHSAPPIFVSSPSTILFFHHSSFSFFLLPPLSLFLHLILSISLSPSSLSPSSHSSITVCMISCFLYSMYHLIRIYISWQSFSQEDVEFEREINKMRQWVTMLCSPPTSSTLTTYTHKQDMIVYSFLYIQTHQCCVCVCTWNNNVLSKIEEMIRNRIISMVSKHT